MDRRSWSLRLSRPLTKLLAIVGLVVVLVMGTPVDKWWAKAYRGEGYYPQGEVLIVLGGSEFSDGTMGWSSYLRSEYAVRNFKAGGFRTVVVTGGPVTCPLRLRWPIGCDAMVCPPPTSASKQLRTALARTHFSPETCSKAWLDGKCC